MRQRWVNSGDGLIHTRVQDGESKRGVKGTYRRRDYSKELANICLGCKKAYCPTGRCKDYTDKAREVMRGGR